MACSHGLATNIEQALDMVPIQMILCLQATAEEPAAQELSPQEFFGGLLVASEGQVEVQRAG